MARVKKTQVKSAKGPTKKSKAAAKVAAKTKALHTIADEFSVFRPAREVLRRVTAVPTIFPQFDHAVGVGGLPLERFMLIHGPSNEGKTILTHGLMLSFLKRAHFAVFIDAEYTTPITWLETLMGRFADHERFLAFRPTTYEETVDAVRDFAKTLVRLRLEGKVEPDTSALIVVDSIRKLVPKNLLAKITAGTDKGGVDGMSGRGAMIKAAMNAAWMDELVPLLAKSNISMVVIARETDDPEADANDRRYGGGFKVGGGKAIYFDSSLVMRVERVGWVYEKPRAKGDEDYVKQAAIGERTRITISKTKVAQKEDKVQIAYFHTSNGTLMPEGFDTPRDVVELAERFGIVKVSGSWYVMTFDGAESKHQGKMNLVRALHENPALFDALSRDVRAAFAKHKPIEQLVALDGAKVIHDDVAT